MFQPPAKMGESSGSTIANSKPASTENGKGKKAKPATKSAAKPGAKSKAKPEVKPEVKKEKAVKTLTKCCAVLFGDSGPVVASSPSFDLGSKMGARLGLVVPPVGQSFFGLQLLIPRDPGQEISEATGRGVCHAHELTMPMALPADHKIIAKFPRGKISCSYDPVPQAVQAKFPTITNWASYSYVTVKLNGVIATVDGYGQAFANAAEPELEKWINCNEPITESVTLLDVLHQQMFFFVLT
ncbi:hypothetical protein ACHAQI_009422 [Fusarium lateritium]